MSTVTTRHRRHRWITYYDYSFQLPVVVCVDCGIHKVLQHGAD